MGKIDVQQMFGLPEQEDCRFPQSGSNAALMAILFMHLGGTFHIDRDGSRRVMIPEPCSFRLSDKPLPHFRDARPHEKFLNGDEFRGAMKLVTNVLHPLDDAYKAFIYDAFAYVFTPVDAANAREARNG